MDSKPALQSQTIIAAVIVIVTSVAAVIGHPIGGETASDLTAILAGVWAIYGRYRATGQISGLLK